MVEYFVGCLLRSYSTHHLHMLDLGTLISIVLGLNNRPAVMRKNNCYHRLWV